MISKIDIEKFGLYKSYNWDTEIGNQEVFRKLNIIYGRNYSGKTTLSRIFRSLEEKTTHSDYSNAEYQFKLFNQNIIESTNLSCSENDFITRVYNTDFVRDNLSWLHNSDGSIQPFTILGAKNIEFPTICEFRNHLKVFFVNFIE